MKEITSSVLAIIILAAPPRDITRAEAPPNRTRLSFETSKALGDWPVPPGWPYQMSELVAPELIQPVVVDLDNDGAMEIVVLTLHDLRVLTPEGAMHSGAWPFEFPIDFGTGNLNLAIADMDDDTDLEIVFSRNQPSLVDPNTVEIHVFNLDGTYTSGWPQAVEGLADRILVADLDADGSNEIVVGTYFPAYIYVLRSDGTPFDSAWPREFEWYVRTVSVVDLDGDSDLEILASDAALPLPDLIYAMHHDATDVKGWPIEVPTATKSLIVSGDVDHDGIPEVAFGVFHSSIGSLIYLLDASGNPHNAGWPLVLPTSDEPASVALSDIDGDGHLDVLVTGRMREIFAFDRFGTPLPGWPAIIPFPGPGPNPYRNRIHAVADVDSDGMPEVVVGTVVGPFVFNHDATLLPGADPLPIDPVFRNAQLPHTATVADVDLDGDVELFSGIWRTLYAWDFPGPECSVQWPRSSGNLGNTGAVTPPAVDTSEWVLFNACLTGPAPTAPNSPSVPSSLLRAPSSVALSSVPSSPSAFSVPSVVRTGLPPECQCLDSDGDSDIDLHDFAALQRVFTP